MNPEHADAISAQQRQIAFRQRLRDAQGGQLAHTFGVQMGMTFAAVHYASLRAKGFRFLPIQGGKYRQYTTLLFAGLVGAFTGRGMVRVNFGDDVQANYLMDNHEEILKGDKPMN